MNTRLGVFYPKAAQNSTTSVRNISYTAYLLVTLCFSLCTVPIWWVAGLSDDCIKWVISNLSTGGAEHIEKWNEWLHRSA